MVYDIISNFENNIDDTKDFSAEVGIAIDDIVQNNLIVDWVENKDIQNMMLNKIEEYLYEVKDKHGISLSFGDIDAIMEQSLNVAKNRYAKY